MNRILITNNPMADKKFSGRCETVFLENASLTDVLCAVRDKIHEGHELLSHPLSGSVKPGQTPYKSVMISRDKGELDIDSLRIIEDSIAAALRQIGGKGQPFWPPQILKDFQLIDMDLIAIGIDK